MIYVTDVTEGGAAAESGIQVGDVILEYNGVSISSSKDLAHAKLNSPPSERGAEVLVGRKGDSQSLILPRGHLGISTEELASPPPFSSTCNTGYGYAVGMSQFVSFLGWSAVLAGVVALFSANSRYGVNITVTVLGFVSIFFGFVALMGAQMTRATVDTADYTREILNHLVTNSENNDA